MGVVRVSRVVHGGNDGGRLEMRLWLCLGGARARGGGRRRVIRTCDRRERSEGRRLVLVLLVVLVLMVELVVLVVLVVLLGLGLGLRMRLLLRVG